MQDNSFYDYLVIHRSVEGEGIAVLVTVGGAVDLPLLMEGSKRVKGGGVTRGGSAKEGRAVVQVCRTLMNDRPIRSCHPARRVSALARMDSRGGNMSWL